LPTQEGTTDFRGLQASYALREAGSVFCIADAYPVTPGHSLVIPRRHGADGLDLHQPEWNAVVELLKQRWGVGGDEVFAQSSRHRSTCMVQRSDRSVTVRVSTEQRVKPLNAAAGDESHPAYHSLRDRWQPLERDRSGDKGLVSATAWSCRWQRQEP
jgi:hypothetical protein